MKKKVYMGFVGILLLVGALFSVFLFSKVEGHASLRDFEGDITIYRSGGCGCCGGYKSYLEKKGNTEVKIVSLENTTSIEKKYGVPEGLESCHTMIIGDYFIEGHVPLEAIDKLLEEKPNIAGIAMAGMPQGSPGMPGTKKGDFIIYAVNHDGSYKEFMRI